MRLIEFEGKTARLPERDYKQLLKRFDVSRASWQRDSYYIYERCICPNYTSCIACPLNRFSLYQSPYQNKGCRRLLLSFISKPIISVSFWDKVFWPVVDNKQAREEINLIRDKLLALKRVR